jgi:hypothetical protein
MHIDNLKRTQIIIFTVTISGSKALVWALASVITVSQSDFYIIQ